MRVKPEYLAAVKEEQDKVFYVDGFGEVGIANLFKFVPSKGEKSQYVLEIGESSFGVASNQPEKITRVR